MGKGIEPSGVFPEFTGVKSPGPGRRLVQLRGGNNVESGESHVFHCPAYGAQVSPLFWTGKDDNDILKNHALIIAREKTRVYPSPRGVKGVPAAFRFHYPADDTLRYMIRFRYLILFAALFFSCKTSDTSLTSAPPPPPAPPAGELWGALRFERLTAENPDRFTLYFALDLENPRPDRAEVTIKDWHITINDRNAPKGAAPRLVSEIPQLEPRSKACFSLGLDLDMTDFSLLTGEDMAEYETALEVTLGIAFDRHADETVLVRGEAIIPRIQEPEFTITAIAVSWAEETRFRVNLQIANPNGFPLELSSLTYSFYGDGAFWADGKKELLLHIPAGGFAETQVFLMTSALEPRLLWRDDLDQLKQVQYRLTGESMIHTNIIFLPAFRMDFDLSRPLRGPQRGFP